VRATNNTYTSPLYSYTFGPLSTANHKFIPLPFQYYQLVAPVLLLNPPLNISLLTFPSTMVCLTIPSTCFGATLANQIPWPSSLR